MLVCLGSALFVLITFDTLPNETARIIAGIATGIGFLGAGTIFKAKDEVHGLTTAASVWAVAAVGLSLSALLLSHAMVAFFYLFAFP